MSSSRLALLMLIGLVPLGCEQLDFRSQTPENDREIDLDDDDDELEEFDTKLETKLLGEYTTIAGLNKVVLEGVGLVVGLKNTGAKPPPSYYATELLDDMRKRGVNQPNTILASKTTALVLVRAELPSLMKKGEKFDVEVRIPGNSDSSSLEGGYLLPCSLSEQAIVPGQGVKKGHVLAHAAGPVMVNTIRRTDDQRASLGALLRRGRILAGAVATQDQDLTLYLRNDFRNTRMVTRVAGQIGQRFFWYNKSGIMEPLAIAKTDQVIDLRVHPQYKDNFPRYLQVIRNIAANERRVARRVRMQRLREEMLNPVTAEKASYQLEAIGKPAIPTLKRALQSKNLECRFHAAAALAYLNDPSGLKVLAKAAKEESAFRIYALAALSASNDSEANILLKKLMQETSAELRYGAFRALTVLDADDPVLDPVPLKTDQFKLHIIDTEAAPLIHLTHHNKSEVVLFGRGLKFKTPLMLRAGNRILLTAAAGSDTIKVSRFNTNGEDKQPIVSTNIAEVIQAVTELGGYYPDVASMLIQADRQGNLPGRLELDALPRSGRTYVRKMNGSSSRTRIGSRYLTPNLYENETDDRERNNTEPEQPELVRQSEPDAEPIRTANATDDDTSDGIVLTGGETEMEMPENEMNDAPKEPRRRVWSRLNPRNWFGGRSAPEGQYEPE